MEHQINQNMLLLVKNQLLTINNNLKLKDITIYKKNAIFIQNSTKPVTTLN